MALDSHTATGLVTTRELPSHPEPMLCSVAEFVTLAHVAILTALPFGYCLNSQTPTMFLTWGLVCETTLNCGGVMRKHA
jgi:hypothetical protein